MSENEILTTIIKVIADKFGSSFAQFGTGSNKRPALFKEKAEEVKQKLVGLFPNCSVSLSNATTQGNRHYAKYFRESDGAQVKLVVTDYDLTLRVVGGDALDLCKDIKNWLIASDTATTALADVGIGVIESVIGVISQKTSLNNVTRDSAFTILTLTASDQVVEQVYPMTNVIVDVGLRYPASEENTENTTVNIP